MAINIKNQIFTLHTKNSTYQMKVDEQNMLIHTYYGNRTDDTDCSYLIRMADRGFSGNIPGTDRERVYSLDFLPQEFPVYGDGDYRVDCLKADLGSGVQDGMFFFDSYQIREGKYNIPGLPAFFSSEKWLSLFAVPLERVISFLAALLVLIPSSSRLSPYSLQSALALSFWVYAESSCLLSIHSPTYCRQSARFLQ